MKSDFEENVYNAACKTIGEAVWQLVAAGEKISQREIARGILKLSERKPSLAESIALSVLNSRCS